MKLGLALGARLEGASHAHVRRALEAGCTPEEIRHVALLAVTTLGFPAMMTALGWVEDVLGATCETTMIEHLFVSPGLNTFRHHGGPAGEHPIIAVDAFECISGRGIRGDRFFDFKADYKGQITFFAMKTFEALCSALGVEECRPCY